MSNSLIFWTDTKWSRRCHNCHIIIVTTSLLRGQSEGKGKGTGRVRQGGEHEGGRARGHPCGGAGELWEGRGQAQAVCVHVRQGGEERAQVGGRGRVHCTGVRVRWVRRLGVMRIKDGVSMHIGHQS